MRHLAPLAFALLVSSALLIACSDNEERDYAATVPSATPVSTPATATPAPLPNELGEAPVFWRTEDGFASLTAGVPYKIVLRVTNGYAEEAIEIVAQRGNGAPPTSVGSTAERVEPGEGEAPGSYYTTNLELPEGPWRLSVLAGEDTASLEVTAAPAD